jgi:two-component system, chemotaxis family, CheB/CheR fusion protein
MPGVLCYIRAQMAHTGEPIAVDRLLEHLRQSRGFDFTAYKRASLMRRVLKRMHALDIKSFDEYLDYLQVRPDEFLPLFNTILINVTSFFRDADVWQTFRAVVVPALNGGPERRDPVRIWSAGCAAGQEAYSAAIMLAEELGMEGFRERVKIYATDVDEEALAQARHATYSSRQIADIPEWLVDKYFDRNGDVYTFNRELRRSVIFGRNDLIQDAPISRIDLLLCRNTLMYFNAEAQARIMARFYFSVNPGGFLVLGRAEMLFSHTAMFQPVDLQHRIFKTIPKAHSRDRLRAQSDREDEEPPSSDYARLRDVAFDSGADGELMLDMSGRLIAANALARRQFNLRNNDLRAPFHDLELSYRPAELRAAIDLCHQDGREVALRNVPWDHSGLQRFLDVVVSPLFDENRQLIGTRISFLDVTPMKTLQDELRQSKQELETAYEELQSTNEELETTNEESQSTVEELETTNEELQSTNEELETMNEELQSTNEELQTMNEELRNRSTELNSTNAFLESVFTSLRSAVVVLDRDMRVKVWNAGATNLWGLRSDEVQRSPFFALDIGLPVGELHQPIRDVVNGQPYGEVTVAAISRKGKSFQCRIGVSPLTGSDDAVVGAILLMEEQTQPV